MKERLQAPDFVKGIAIVLMVYGHLPLVGTWAGFQDKATSWIYSFHMPLFLMVSGMFFSLEGDLLAKTKRLLLRIGVPYAVFISGYLLGLKLIQLVGIPTSNAPPHSAAAFVKAVLLFPYGGYWFLHSLLLIQLALLLGQWMGELFRHDDNATGWLLSLLLLSGLMAFDMVKLRTVLYFLVGMGIGSIGGRTLRIPLSLAVVGMLLVLAIHMFIPFASIRVFGFAEVVWCLCILATLFAVANTVGRSRLIGFLAWIGQNSLAILVFHAIFIVVLKPAAGASLRLDPTGWLYSLSATAIATALCLISVWFCDKLGISRFLFATTQCYIPFHQQKLDGTKK